MEVIFLVHISQPLKSLKKNISDLRLREKLVPGLHDLVNILIKILKDKVESSIFQDDLV